LIFNCFNKHCGYFLKFLLILTRIMCIFRKDKYSFTCMTCRLILLRKRYFSERICSRNHERHFIFNGLFSENRDFYESMLKHVLQTDKQTRNTSEYTQHSSSDFSEKKLFYFSCLTNLKIRRNKLRYSWEGNDHTITESRQFFTETNQKFCKHSVKQN
jgi:hypothetical protein